MKVYLSKIGPQRYVLIEDKNNKLYGFLECPKHKSFFRFDSGTLKKMIELENIEPTLLDPSPEVSKILYLHSLDKEIDLDLMEKALVPLKL